MATYPPGTPVNHPDIGPMRSPSFPPIQRLPQKGKKRKAGPKKPPYPKGALPDSGVVSGSGGQTAPKKPRTPKRKV